MENISAENLWVAYNTGAILLLPLLSFLVANLLPDRIGWLVHILSTLLLVVASVLALVVFFTVEPDSSYIFNLPWFDLGGTNLQFSLLINDVTLIMLVTVTLVSTLVHLYSIGYMAGDPGIRKYFAWLGFFTFSMLGILVAGNLLVLFAFWELVGFSSYILIGYWMEKPEAASAARKAFIMNRLGDLGFLTGLMIIWANTSSFDITILSHTGGNWKTLASLCIFFGVIGKSAQIPLFTWLPDAMEGPIPVSALLHAATMVAAGVFLLVRMSFLFSVPALHIVAVVGLLTALLGALCALHHFDIKKILAYSTISQLGLMIFSIGTGSGSASLEHLYAHAFYKACLFLAAGSVIYMIQQVQRQSGHRFDAQDIRNLGGLRAKMPITFSAFIISGASLAGVPFTSGFLSKDAILTGAFVWADNPWKLTMFIVAFAISVLTVIYTFRMIWFLFFAREKHELTEVSEPPAVMRLPVILLAIGSLWLTLSNNPFVMDRTFLTSVTPSFHLYGMTWVSIIVSACMLTGAWFYYRNREKPGSIPFFLNGFHVDSFLQKLFNRPVTQLASLTASIDKKLIDRSIHGLAYVQVALAHIIGWIDNFLVDGLVNLAGIFSRWIGNMTRSLHGGKIQLYILWAVLGLVIFLFFTLNTRTG